MMINFTDFFFLAATFITGTPTPATATDYLIRPSFAPKWPVMKLCRAIDYARMITTIILPTVIEKIMREAKRNV
jgi:hypothetical protein